MPLRSGFSRPWHAFYDKGVAASLEYPRVSVAQLFTRAAEKTPDLVHLHFLGAEYRYGETLALAKRFASAMQALGVVKGTRVALFLPNCPQMVIAFFGVLMAGGVVVPTNPLYTGPELEHQMNDSGAEVIVVLSRFFPTVQAVRARTKLKHVIVTNIKEYMPGLLRFLFTLLKEKKDGHRVPLPSDPAVTLWKDEMALGSAAPKPIDVLPEDLCLLQYTGGTTGVSKGAMLTHANLVANVVQCQAWLSDLQVGHETFLCSLPFFHVFGMTVCELLGTSISSKLVLVPDPKDVKKVLATISAQKPSIFPGVPRMYAVINQHPDTPKHDLRSIRACISGAAPLPIEVKRKFEAVTGGKLVEGYGLTECSPVTHANPLQGVNKEGHIGLPLPDTDVRLMDLETAEKEVAEGERGELAINGPQVMKGYWNRPDETAKSIRNGWLLTGDIAVRDSEGYFKVVDRKKELIIVGGFNVYPRDVEEVLYAHPKVADCAVCGIPDPKQGTEIVKAYIVLKKGETMTPEEMIAYCKSNLTAYKVPHRVEFRTDLPKTQIGKVLRRVLVEEEKAKQAKGA